MKFLDPLGTLTSSVVHSLGDAVLVPGHMGQDLGTKVAKRRHRWGISHQVERLHAVSQVPEKMVGMAVESKVSMDQGRGQVQVQDRTD